MNRRTTVVVLIACLLSAFTASFLTGVLVASSSAPAVSPPATSSPVSSPPAAAPNSAPSPSRPGEGGMEPGSRCEDAWADVRFADFARGFPLRLPAGEAEQVLPTCAGAPTRERQVALYREAFAMSARILEKAIRQESQDTGLRPCEVIDDVTRPVTIDVVVNGQRQLAVEGYAKDGILPITYRQWTGGPFRLKYAVGCENHASLWLLPEQGWYADYGDDEHAQRYPTDADALAVPWDFPDIGHNQSACVTYSAALGNDVPGGQGRVLVFDLPVHALGKGKFFTCHELVNGDPAWVDYPVTELTPLP